MADHSRAQILMLNDRAASDRFHMEEAKTDESRAVWRAMMKPLRNRPRRGREDGGEGYMSVEEASRAVAAERARIREKLLEWAWCMERPPEARITAANLRAALDRICPEVPNA